MRSKLPQAALALGGLAFLTSLPVCPQRAWASLLLASYALCQLALSAAFILAVTYPMRLSKVAPRRVLLALTDLLPYGSVGVALVTVLHPGLYAWSHDRAGFTPFQQAWFNAPFFALRALVYLGLWRWLVGAVTGLVRRRMAADSPALRAAHGRLTALFAYVYAVTVWLSSYDWIMSLEPRWSSTIFGLYSAAGALLSALAVLTLLLPAAALDRRDRHDLGQWLFGVSCLWVYLWFSQFLLVWYVNLPEETVWFTRRLTGAWGLLFYLNVGLNWIAPFLVLLLREAKSSASVLTRIAVVLLLGRWLDLFLLIMPPVQGARLVIGWPELGLAAGALGLLLAVVRSAAEADHD